MNASGVVVPRRLRRAVITGGAGFIGSHLCDRLLQRGMRVVCLDNLLTGSIDNVAHLFSNPRFSFRHYDVTEYLYVEDEVDAILHFASPASPVDYAQMPIETLKVGTLGTHKALGLARAKRARFLLASTSEVYGDPEVHPQSEEYWGNVNPVGPRSIYDEAKRAAEAFVMAYHNAHGLDTRIARIFNTFGPRMRRGDGRAVPAFITQALAGEPLTVFGDGSQTRSLCYIDDLVDGLERLLAADCHLPVNLGNPGELTVLELAETIRRLVGGDSPVELRPLPVDDPRRRRPDIARARELLGWSPRVGLEEGLARTVSWWQEGGPHARVDLATAAG
ncbi:MAG: putative sugar-nucleotide epimerase/dehydratase [Chloroflexi bacterium]|jgi:dTDP-glucose 4,6-dehydratase|nr:putative sugar-nucleotide epimerase/dehydratase [Chloroflexota bacterium]